ncbi:ureidoglycolate hydrolase [Xylona heveae TC161]|uniref:Ureidoglycolate hydrolase n=1 Tax=Xylona heveae (strain CBS 132557 / TC161) TaxID=1328760 RepID=A0A165IJF2_XYLHT|nr:ureidoglycolate hydrolase [Xylona heveae TC161]KZF24978.1 ureidoglycolate hydrolase [Xylona heveae TC161]
MPISVTAPSQRVPVLPLTQETFAPFGTVVENPNPTTLPPRSSNQTAASLGTQPPPSPIPVVVANQGTALKYLDVTLQTDLYGKAPSGKPSRAIMTMFVCAPRNLRPDPSSPEVSTEKATSIEGLFDVSILERHPFTQQTFVPMGLSAEDPDTRYLVLVAPTLPVAQGDAKTASYPTPCPPQKSGWGLKSLFSRSPAEAEKTGSAGKGPGLPDLANIKAFVATGAQAVTYAAGTWHAPMVVLGKRSVDFVVTQFANSVGDEDCQEVEIQPETPNGALAVVVPKHEITQTTALARAKL